jgi:hypothetical protein
MFGTCIIVVDLKFVDFRFCLFLIEIYKIASKCELLPLVSNKMLGSLFFASVVSPAQSS